MNQSRSVRIVVLACLLCATGIVAAGGSTVVQEPGIIALAGGSGGGAPAPLSVGAAVYDGLPATLPGSYPSLGYEATSTDEFGDYIALAGTDRDLLTVVVSLTDWACENDFDPDGGGGWIPNRDGYGPAFEACATTPGSGFMHPITLNIYEVDHSGVDPDVGPLVATKTESFFIPFRPSWDSVNCTAAGETPDTNAPFGGKWFDPVLGLCVNGYAFTIEFDFTADGIVLPDEVIYTVAYNSANHGETPIGAPGPYSSLNVSVTDLDPTIGTDVEEDALFWDTSFGPFYADGGAGGTDFLRRDTLWTPYTLVGRFTVKSVPLPMSGPRTLALLGIGLLLALAAITPFALRRATPRA